jgi:exosortase D (VPLPA-CTERM-specific)
MISRWDSADFNYAYIIPFVVLYLLWDRKKEFMATPTRPSWLGFIPIAAGVGFYWLGELGGEYYTLYLSSWLLLLGILLLHLGWQKLKVIWFGLLIILAMFPPPHFIYQKISLSLKLISSKIGVFMIQAWGVPAYREGNIIDLGFTRLQVVDACSGLRYLIPLIVLGLILAYFYRAKFWKRLIVVAATVPLSVVLNSARVGLTGILSKYWGPEVAQGFFHDFSGWVIFMISLAILLGLMWLLSKLPGKPPPREAPPPSSLIDGRPYPYSRSVTLFVVAGVLMFGTLLLTQKVDYRERVPSTKPFYLFPTNLGEWNGEKNTMERRIIEELDLSDYYMANYSNTEGKNVNFYVAYYESQRKGESIHSPGSCLPGSGWKFEQSGKATFKVDEIDRIYAVNRAVMKKGEATQISYYWFPQRGRILTNAYELKFYVFWDALTMQRTDGALVRMITPVYPNEEIEDADERLKDFANDAVPVLREYLPGREINR